MNDTNPLTATERAAALILRAWLDWPGSATPPGTIADQLILIGDALVGAGLATRGAWSTAEGEELLERLGAEASNSATIDTERAEDAKLWADAVKGLRRERDVARAQVEALCQIIKVEAEAPSGPLTLKRVRSILDRITSRGRPAAAPATPTPPIRSLIGPPPGSTAGVTIELLTTGPLAGWAVVDIPAGGVLGEDEHTEREVGIMLAGRMEVGLGVRFKGGSYLVVDRYSVPPGVRHSLRALDADVRILARLEDAGATP
jgi:quercetin dioxygenase-like cupin family protein